MGIRPHPALIEVLRCAYLPCSYIDKCSGECLKAKWRPACGHIPRGFLGATGDLEEVELVMLFAEPGRPHDDEVYGPKADPIELLLASVQHTYKCFRDCRDPFHKNARCFLQQLYPKLSFDAQLRRVWITQSRRCSDGSKNDTVCAKRYLAPQIKLLRNAMVVAFGKKAQHRLQQLAKRNGTNVRWLSASALSPPEANKPRAKQSWEEAIDELCLHIGRHRSERG